MSEHQHFTAPDVGIHATDLFTYEPTQPGTGGLVCSVAPVEIPARETLVAQTPELRIALVIDRQDNTAAVTLTHKTNPVSTDRQVFHLTETFLRKQEVSLTILFDKWKIVAVIDGKPLLVHHSGWVGAQVDQDAALPAEYHSILEQVADQPANTRTMWRYALVLLMIHDEKARFVETRLDGETLHLAVETLDGKRFSITRPPMSEEAEQILLEQIRELVGQEAAAKGDKDKA